MSYFPVFINLDDKSVLLVGAGAVGERKLEKLAMFASNIRVVSVTATSTSMEIIEQKGLKFENREFDFSDLKGADLVVVAVDDLELQGQIFAETQKNGVLCNSVDSPDYCSFIFPALVKRGDLTIGISTGGRAPGLSRQVRKQIERVLPDDLKSIVEQVSEYREKLKTEGLETFKERAEQVNQFVERLLNRSAKP